jgi:hypothetical protein
MSKKLPKEVGKYHGLKNRNEKVKYALRSTEMKIFDYLGNW